MTTLQVEIAGEQHQVSPGQVFTMGRAGDLVIDDNPYLHRSFLSLAFAEGFWWVANVGNRASAQLADHAGLSRSTLTPGARMPLVFPRTVVTFAAGPHSYEINLYVETLAFEVAHPTRVPSGDTTIGAISFTDSQLLVILAVAEPLLRRSGAGAWEVPTAVQAAQRLGWTQTRFNRKLDNVCDKLDRVGIQGLKGGRGEQALNRRSILAEYAVNSHFVTALDLSVLDDESRRNGRMERA